MKVLTRESRAGNVRLGEQSPQTPHHHNEGKKDENYSYSYRCDTTEEIYIGNNEWTCIERRSPRGNIIVTIRIGSKDGYGMKRKLYGDEDVFLPKPTQSLP